jgi:hypothetical protein
VSLIVTEEQAKRRSKTLSLFVYKQAENFQLIALNAIEC